MTKFTWTYIEQSFKRLESQLQALHYHAVDLRGDFAAAIKDLLSLARCSLIAWKAISQIIALNVVDS